MAKLVLLACAALLVLNGAFVRGADPCVLDGFDLQAMERYDAIISILSYI